MDAEEGFLHEIGVMPAELPGGTRGSSIVLFPRQALAFFEAIDCMSFLLFAPPLEVWLPLLFPGSADGSTCSPFHPGRVRIQRVTPTSLLLQQLQEPSFGQQHIRLAPLGPRSAAGECAGLVLCCVWACERETRGTVALAGLVKAVAYVRTALGQHRGPRGCSWPMAGRHKRQKLASA